MKNDRIKNASRNMFFAVLLKAYQILVPFLMRTAMIYLMGVQYLGLSGLFASVLQVLNLAELGIGTAMVYSMYKPIAENDHVIICALLRLYKMYYRIIGLVIAGVGVVLTPFIPKLISGEAPVGINIYILYLLNLGATVLSYWLFAYKNSLLQAHQRGDVTSKVSLITNTVQYGVQLLVLWMFHNYYLYVIVALLSQALANILLAVVATRMYPDYQPEGELDKNSVKGINQRIKDLFTAKLGNVVIGSADTIVISSFCGLLVLAVYQNYYFILNSLYGMFLVLFGAVTAGIGNSLVAEGIEKNLMDMKKFTFIACWLITVCECCFATLYQPFMKLWVGEELMLHYTYVILFCICFYVMVLSMVWATIKDAAGLWHYDRFRPLIGAIANVVMNIILVQFIGLYGVLLSTILSYLFITMPWMVHNLFKLLYKRSCLKYVQRLLLYMLVCIFSCFVTVTLCNMITIDGIPALIVYGMLAVVIPNIIQTIVYRHLYEFNESKILVGNILRVGEKNAK